MPFPELGRNVSASSGIAFLVAAGIVFEIVAYSCSSPQTAELNAAKRAETLMKWVYIGEAQSILFLGLAATFDRKNRMPILAGGAIALVISHGLYTHAKASGLRKTHLPPTEDW